jgi:hypothetical protein
LSIFATSQIWGLPSDIRIRSLGCSCQNTLANLKSGITHFNALSGYTAVLGRIIVDIG